MTFDRPIVLGARASVLAQVQARLVGDVLRRASSGPRSRILLSLLPGRSRARYPVAGAAAPRRLHGRSRRGAARQRHRHRRAPVERPAVRHQSADAHRRHAAARRHARSAAGEARAGSRAATQRAARVVVVRAPAHESVGLPAVGAARASRRASRSCWRAAIAKRASRSSWTASRGARGGQGQHRPAARIHRR